jgi:hypothetical protein
LPNLNKSISTNELRFINKIPNNNGYYRKHTETSKYIFPSGETAGDVPTVGVYFIAENNDRIKADTEDVVINNPSELLIRIPDLRSGSYKLEVVTQFAGSSILLKQVRSTEFNKTLTVG